MRMYDIIVNKRRGIELTDEEIDYFVEGYTKGEIPDYQVSALLMAILWKGMTSRETARLTFAMAHSGDMVDLSAIDGIKVDKHSTGGVGDKTTLVVAPIVACCGVYVAKMSGKGLGHTGGTIDKIESIPGCKVEIAPKEFIDIVNKVGVAVIGQSGNIAPADKKLYALRDTTGTVESIPLIASSVMSKKLAAGADVILLDVKTGSGAFMKTIEDSVELAKTMVNIGKDNGKSVAALVTNMDIPLGDGIGNWIEVCEAVKTLKNQGPNDFTTVCKALASNILMLAGIGDNEHCDKIVDEAIDSGRAYNKLLEMVEAQGGDTSMIEDMSLYPKAKVEYNLLAENEGYITSMNSEKCGIASVILGAGRNKKEDVIDYSAGIILAKKTGDYVKVGDVIATFYTSDEKFIASSKDMFMSGIKIGEEKPKQEPLIYETVY